MISKRKTSKKDNLKDNIATIQKKLTQETVINKKILDSIHDGVIIADSRGLIQTANAMAMELLQISDKELKKQSIQSFLHRKMSGNQSDHSIEESIRKRLGISETKYFSFRKSDGSLTPVEYSTHLLHDNEHNLIGILIVFRDVSGRLSAEKNVVKQACYDYLTGLPNRSFFEETLTHILHLLKRNNEKLSILIINLDHFKKINDFFGHQTGDEILKTVALRLQHMLRKSDYLGRLGADEFVILLDGICEVRSIVRSVENMMKHIKQPIITQHKKKQINITASIGIAVADDPEITAQKLLSNADIAVQYCKESGRDCYRFHSQELELENTAQLSLEHELRQAIKNHEFMMYYQPEFSVNGTLIGFETLLRWNHPQKGIVPAGEFIDTLEKTRLIIDAGRWAIFHAVSQWQQWLSQGIVNKNIFLAVNISAIEFESHEFVDLLIQYIKENKFDPSVIVAEVTESAIMKDIDASAKLLLKLHDLGFRISIDDFGKGHSSLAYLKKFPVSALKIDGIFVKEITSSDDDLSIVKIILALAKALNLHVIAECVETQQQLDLLKEIGCDSVQGYLLGKPLSPEATVALCQKEARILS